MHRCLKLIELAPIVCGLAVGQTFPLETMDGLKPHKAKVEAAVHKGKKEIRVTGMPGAAGSGSPLLLLPVKDFESGTIEAEISGEPGAGAGPGARGFVGIAFRIGEDMDKYDAFYLRPTNGRAEDQVRRNHSAQYISHPAWTWQRLRKEEPEKYESYVDLAPGEWTRVRIEVDGVKARLYVHGGEQPALVVSNLKQGAWKGQVGLWIEPGTIGHFRNVKVTKK